MKFLIQSNAPWVKTGYGVQCRYLVERLADLGHDVAVACTYGLAGDVMPWGSRRITVYPTGYAENALDIVHNHAMHHFDGDESNGWVIPLLDVWCLVPNPRYKDFNVAAWTPVDHFPVPRDVLEFFHRNPDAVPIAMSRYGEVQLAEAGLNPVYIPLAVDTGVYKPTPTVTYAGSEITGRELMSMDDPVPDEAFVVGMVAMNKGWSRDRKGFNEALRAFGQFWERHPEAVLYMHTDWPGGLEGVNLKELAIHASVPEHAIRWVSGYAYQMGYTAEMMAALYTGMDVLLAPSHGEGFCVPLIEAQACGTPVIAADFSSQRELASPEFGAAGWLVAGQGEWDPPQHASYVCPYTFDVLRALEEAYMADMKVMAPIAVAFAAQYDADRVFQNHWMPFLDSLDQKPEVLELDREPMDWEEGEVAVVIPAMKRPGNVAPLIASLQMNPEGWNTAIYFVCDPEDHAEIAAVEAAGANVIVSDRGSSYAQKANCGLANTTEPWVFLCGDDVRFHPGWIDEARKLSDRFDVIGTNDTTGAVKNPDVAAGRHADHFFVRRSYIDTYGACLDGPGVLAPEVYGHWFTDKEIVELAKARHVFTPCLESIVEHLHPGYDNQPRDDVYLKAIDTSEADRKTFMSRVPLIEMQRTGRGK